MTSRSHLDISLAITGSGGAGVITVGELLLRLAGKNGRFGSMRRSFGPQIRGGEAAALVRISDKPVACMNDGFDVLLAIDWRNADRFAEEIILSDNGVIIADPDAGPVPQVFLRKGVELIEIPMKSLAQAVPNGRPNMLALGLLAQWLGFEKRAANSLIKRLFADKGEDIVKGSKAAFIAGYTEPHIVKARNNRQIPQSARAHKGGKVWQISGNEACGLGALRGGIRFSAAYPITPASDLLEWLAPRLQQLGGSLVQAEDELASINMVIGASFGGVPSLTATSGPGLALMTEAMGLAVAAEIPVVVVDVMRGGPSTGLPTKSEQTDLDIALHGLHGDAPHLVLGALDHADCILTTEWAVRLAEAMQTLAIVLSDQNLAQSRVLMPEPDYTLPKLPARNIAPQENGYQRYQVTGTGVSSMASPGTPGNMYVADGLEHSASGTPSSAAIDHQAQLDKRSRKISKFRFGKLWADISGKGTTAIITWGSTSSAVKEAAARLRASGAEVRVIAIRLLLPASPAKLATALKGVNRVLIVEQSHSQQFYRYLRAYYDIDGDIRVFARPGPLLISPQEVVQHIQSWSES